MRRQRDDERRAYPVHRVGGRAGYRAITAKAPAPVRCAGAPGCIQASPEDIDICRRGSGESAGPGRSRVGRVAAMTAGDLPVIEFAFPGALRDQLVAAILTGAKTTTTGLLADYEREREPLPAPGLRQVVIDSAGRPVGIIVWA